MQNLTNDMRYNALFDQPVVIRPEDYQWLPSPMPGVERMMLDRVGGEIARATSIVCYQPNSAFSAHTHGGGEEYLVLKGTFADENGSYPTGTYVRNPVGTAHTPIIGSDGATIFVKLNQFTTDDTEQKNINTHTAQWLPGVVDGLSIMPLHDFSGEHVALVRWAPNTIFNAHHHWGGEEILVVEGTFYDEQGSYPQGTWLRNPHLSHHTP